jgi:hypothetical protein
MSLGGAFAFLIQHKGFPYHTLGFLPTSLGAAAMVAGDRSLPRGGAPPHWVSRRTLQYLALALAAIGLLFSCLMALRYDSNLEIARLCKALPVWATIHDATRPGDRVLALSNEVSLAYPAMEVLDRRPASRYPWMFPARMMQCRRSPACSGGTPAVTTGPDPLEQRFLAELTLDVANSRPRLIIVTARPDSLDDAMFAEIRAGGCTDCPAGASSYDYFRDRGFLAPLLKDYHPLLVPTDADNLYFERNDS